MVGLGAIVEFPNWFFSFFVKHFTFFWVRRIGNQSVKRHVNTACSTTLFPAMPGPRVAFECQ